jgi:hypothetical protein
MGRVSHPQLLNNAQFLFVHFPGNCLYVSFKRKCLLKELTELKIMNNSRQGVKGNHSNCDKMIILNLFRDFSSTFSFEKFYNN